METRKYLFETLWKQYLTEQDVNINQFDDLIGKSVTFKINVKDKDVKPGYRIADLAIKSTIKGIIDTIKPMPSNRGPGVEIKLTTTGLYQQHSLPNWKYDPAEGFAGRIDYFCKDNKFNFLLITDVSTNGIYSRFVPATCRGLYKILSQRYPCKTDLAMSTPTTLPDEFTDLT
jgi:hypothetical protein